MLIDLTIGFVRTIWTSSPSAQNGWLKFALAVALALVRMFLVAADLATAHGQEAVFRGKTDLQSITVRVTNKKGDDVHGLNVGDFTLIEDGRPQKIAFFAAEHQPVSLAILIDSSSSMSSINKSGRIGTLLAPLLQHSSPEDEVFLLPFTDRVGPFQILTAAQRLSPPVALLSSWRGGGTALYDALATALCRLRTARNLQRVVVVITDGVDQHSRLKFQQLLNFAQSSRSQIFIIGFYDNWEYESYRNRSRPVTVVSGQQVDNPLITFERLAKESGAASFFPTSEQELEASVNAVANILNAQYVLAYYPENDERLRKIQVRVNQKGYKVASRHAVGMEKNDTDRVEFLPQSCEVSPKEHPYPWESQLSQTPSKTLLYQEDFSSSQTGWPNNKTSHYKSGFYELSYNPHSDTGAPSAVVGQLGMGQITVPQISTTSTDSAEGVIAANGPWWGSFRASVRIQGQGGLSAGGMVFHLSEQGYYAVLLTDTGTPNEVSLKLVKKFFNSSKETALLPWTSIVVPAPVSTRKFDHKLSVEWNRGRILLELDGQPASEVHDTTSSNGLTGFALFGAGSETFSDLRVEGLP